MSVCGPGTGVVDIAPLAADGPSSGREVDPSRIVWDAVVVGTGIGGATLGHRLALAGKKVLFCERGTDRASNPATSAGIYAELWAEAGGTATESPSALRLAQAGRYHDQVIDESRRRLRHFVPFTGAGTGGSSALYGMALERFAASDFAEKALPSAAGGEPWPLGYEEFSRHYAAAERLYRVRGMADPLRADEAAPGFVASPPPLTAAAANLFDFFAAQGLHPYRLPLACEYVDGCQCCQGFLCGLDCKNDSAKICLRPAMRDGGAVLLDDCQVLRIDADRTRVTGVVCRWRGRQTNLRAHHVFLAAGALQTPNILLRSSSALWPRGLANASGLVGRNLMRHCVDLYLIRPEGVTGTDGFDNRFKEFAFNDFYQVDGVKLGSVQSFGRLPPAPVLFGSLRQDLRNSRFPWTAGPVGLTRPVLQPVLHRMVERSLTLATIMDDTPCLENRVWPGEGSDPGSVRISYRLREADRARVAEFRRRMRGVLQSRRWRLIKQAENNERIAHACGTCRFGDDPETSVLDRNNRCHGLDNLHVVDSSFFPSSGGTNPSLTIAANALRVAEHHL